MKTIKNSFLLIAIILFASFASNAQTTPAPNSQTTKSTTMKTYLIERDIPDAGKLTPEQLKAISQKSCSVLKRYCKLNGYRAMLQATKFFVFTKQKMKN